MHRSTLSTAQRLALAFGMVILLMVISIGFAYKALSSSDAAMQTLYEDRTKALEQLSVIRHIVGRNRIILTDANDTRDEAVITRRLAEYDKNDKIAKEHWDEYIATYLTPEEKVLADRLKQDWATYRTGAEKPTAEALRARQFEQAEQGLKAISKLSPPVQSVLEELVDLQVTVAASTYREASATNDKALYALLGLGVFAVLASIAAATLIVRKVVGVLGAEPHELAQAAQRIADGDLTSLRTAAQHQGSVMGCMEAMREQLNHLVGMVRESAESVAAASGQIAHGTQDLSARTEEQASALQQTAASMEQMNATVRRNAEGASEAQQMTQQASTVAQQGGEAMTQMMDTMKDIEASSKRISDIIAVIDSIAFQTNILALNAAVEAARAGEQGRGFSVVASEVRALASRSAEAAKEIKTLITTSVERVEMGSSLAHRAGKTMGEIVSSIQNVASLMDHMHHAANEQGSGIQQVTHAMGMIDQTTQQNAALVEEMAAASSHLKQQSDGLVDSVASFRLEQGLRALAAPAAANAPRLNYAA